MIVKIKKVTGGIKFFKIKVSVVALVLILCTTITAFATSKIITTDVIYEGESVQVISFTQDVGEIIKKSEFPITQEDFVNLDNFNVESEENSIEIVKAYEVAIIDNSVQVAKFTIAGDVEDALNASNIKLLAGDKVNYTLETKIDKAMKIEIERAFGVTLVCDGESYSYDVSGTTVEEILKSSGVTLGQNDRISHSVDTVLDKETVITIERVIYKEKIETEKIDFETVQEKSSSLYEGETKVKQEGKDGEKTKYFTETYIDGKLADIELKEVKVTKEAVNKIIIIGTKKKPVEIPTTTVAQTTVKPTTTAAPTVAKPTTTASKADKPTTTTAKTEKPVFSNSVNTISQLKPSSPIELDKNGIPVNYKRVIKGPATAYCTGTITSTGVAPIPGRVAVDPNEIPYGTKMYIVSADGKYVYGYSVAADTGGFIHNSNTVVDLYMNSYDQCRNFGRRSVNIYILG